MLVRSNDRLIFLNLDRHEYLLLNEFKGRTVSYVFSTSVRAKKRGPLLKVRTEKRG